MNNIFSFKRLFLMLNKDLQENWKKYILQVITIFGILAIFLTYFADERYARVFKGHYSTQNSMTTLDCDLLMISALLFMVFGEVFASTMMENMRSKTQRIAFLAVPASNFEKILSRWLIVTVGYIACFFVALFLADSVRVAICSFRYPTLDVHFIDFGKMIVANEDVGNFGYLLPSIPYFFFFLSLYFFNQSLFVLGTTFWEKLSFVKTFAVIVILGMVYIFVCRWVITASYEDQDSFFNVLNSFHLKNLSDNGFLIRLTCITSFGALFNWTLAFFRFRESEIIKRF